MDVFIHASWHARFLKKVANSVCGKTLSSYLHPTARLFLGGTVVCTIELFDNAIHLILGCAKRP